MLDIQQKRKFRNFIYHKFTLVTLFLLVLFVLHSTWSVYLKKKESVAMRELSEARLLELESRDAELNNKIKKLGTVSGVEEEIRSKFSVAKSNENMVIIVREESSSTDETTQTVGFWAKLKSLFR